MAERPHPHLLWSAIGAVVVALSAGGLLWVFLQEHPSSYQPPWALVGCFAALCLAGIYTMVAPFVGLPLPPTRSTPIWKPHQAKGDALVIDGPYEQFEIWPQDRPRVGVQSDVQASYTTTFVLRNWSPSSRTRTCRAQVSEVLPAAQMGAMDWVLPQSLRFLPDDTLEATIPPGGKVHLALVRTYETKIWGLPAQCPQEERGRFRAGPLEPWSHVCPLKVRLDAWSNDGLSVSQWVLVEGIERMWNPGEPVDAVPKFPRVTLVFV